MQHALIVRDDFTFAHPDNRQHNFVAGLGHTNIIEGFDAYSQLFVASDILNREGFKTQYIRNIYNKISLLFTNVCERKVYMPEVKQKICNEVTCLLKFRKDNESDTLSHCNRIVWESDLLKSARWIKCR